MTERARKFGRYYATVEVDRFAERLIGKAVSLRAVKALQWIVIERGCSELPGAELMLDVYISMACSHLLETKDATLMGSFFDVGRLHMDRWLRWIPPVYIMADVTDYASVLKSLAVAERSSWAVEILRHCCKVSATTRRGDRPPMGFDWMTVFENVLAANVYEVLDPSFNRMALIVNSLTLLSALTHGHCEIVTWLQTNAPERLDEFISEARDCIYYRLPLKITAPALQWIQAWCSKYAPVLLSSFTLHPVPK